MFVIFVVRSSTGLKRQMYSRQGEDHARNVLTDNFFNKPSSAKNKERLPVGMVSKVFVKKWVDYSTKYGLGYLLSDGSTGICFNDSTKMCLDSLGQ